MDERYSIYKYMTPLQVISHMKEREDRDLLAYLLHVHFPWMNMTDTPSLQLYIQGYLALSGRAYPYIQSMYKL